MAVVAVAVAATFVLISMILTLFVFLRYFGRICAHNVPLRILKYHRISFIPIQFFLFSLFIYRLWLFFCFSWSCVAFFCVHIYAIGPIYCAECVKILSVLIISFPKEKNIVDKPRFFSPHFGYISVI